MGKSLGVGVFVVKDDKILMGQRGDTCKRGKRCWSLPGGYVEPGESIIDAAVREVKEETGLSVLRPIGRLPFAVPDLLTATDHSERWIPKPFRVEHVTFWVMLTWKAGEPLALEPTKCLGWGWHKPGMIKDLPGVCDFDHEQYHWTPLPLWREILLPRFGLI